MGVPPTLAPLITFGTNMAIVVPTAFSGVRRHNRELRAKKLSFPTKHYLSFGVPMGVGGFLGSLAAFTFFTTYPRLRGNHAENNIRTVMSLRRISVYDDNASKG